MGTAPVAIYDYFIQKYPEFSDASLENDCNEALSSASRLFSKDNWGDHFVDAVMLDAAHNIFLSVQARKGGGKGAMQLAAGPVSSVSGGGISTSFNSSSPAGKSHSDDFYQKTIYGQKFLRLRTVVMPRMVL